MFQFIRELNTIYASQNKDSDSQCRPLNVDDMPVYKSFEFLDKSQELKGHELHEAGVPERLPGEGRAKICVRRDGEDYDKPEMVAFVEDNNYHLTKDFCMDNESVCQDDYSIEDYKLDHHNINISSILAKNDAESTDSSEEILERLSCIANELQLVAQDDCKNEQRLSRMFLMENDEDFEDEAEDVWIDHPAEAFLLINPHLAHRRHSWKKLMMEESKNSDGSDTVRSDNPGEKSSHACNKSLTNEKECQEDHEMHRICQIKEAQQVPQTEQPESGMSPESLKTLSHSLKNQEQNEDSSSDPPSGPIEHSGSIPNSGSIRSSCSTTSGYSFVFPILASEWPGSPVKMANADNKQWLPTTEATKKKSRRPRRWRMLVCCKSNIED